MPLVDRCKHCGKTVNRVQIWCSKECLDLWQGQLRHTSWHRLLTDEFDAPAKPKPSKCQVCQNPTPPGVKTCSRLICEVQAIEDANFIKHLDDLGAQIRALKGFSPEPTPEPSATAWQRLSAGIL